MTTGEIIGAEALVRWISKEYGIIYPDEYIPIFENNGFIINMDGIVWEQVFSKLREWMDKGYKVVPISINVSRVHAMEANFADRVLDLSKKYDISPEYIILELTESAFLDETSSIYDSMELLQRNGFKISMDDFGCGYSSLNMLQTVNIDEIKLDRVFLNGLGKNSKSATIIKHIVQLTKALGVSVIPEGVETIEQQDFLIQCGCKEAQGYLYYRPIPMEEFEERFLTLVKC